MRIFNFLLFTFLILRINRGPEPCSGGGAWYERVVAVSPLTEARMVPVGDPVAREYLGRRLATT